jgi:hypothetical protein
LRAPRDEVLAWLEETGVRHDLTPWELRIVEAPVPTERMVINASWRSEALMMLLWALGKIDALPPADTQCNTGLLQDILPPYAEITEAAFLETATRRADAVLLREVERCLDLHAESIAAKRDGKPPRWPVDIEIIQERHHAINWVIGYDGLDWDLVTTDT